MKRSALIRLVVILLAMSMLVALFACEGNTAETESIGPNETELESDTAGESESENDTTVDTDGDETNPGEDETDPGTTKCEHPYAATQDGHWKPACDVCGKPEGSIQQHDYVEKVEDEGDLLLYSLRCKVCKFRAYEQEVPYEINGFYSAGELAYTDTTGSLTGKFGFSAGMGYATYSSENGGSVTVLVKSGGQVEEPSGKFLVMKVRNAASQSSFKASIRSVGAYAGVKQTLNFTGLKSGWVTIIVDLTKANSIQAIKDSKTGVTTDEMVGYHPDASGDYYLGDFSVTATAGVGESFDIAYVMFCDTLEDAKNFTASDSAVYFYDDILNGAPDVETKQCVDENGNPIKHEYVIHDDGTHSLVSTCYQCGLAAVSHEPHVFSQIKLEDGDFTYACSACDYHPFGEDVNINKFFNADSLNVDAKNYYMNTKNGVLTDANGGFKYASFSGNSTTAQLIFTRNTPDSSATEKAAFFTVGTAKYMILRLKTNNPGMNYTFTIATYDAEHVEGYHKGEFKGMFPKTTTFNVPISLGGTDTWTTYVIDLATLAPKSWVADENGNHMIYTLYCNIGGKDYTPNVNFDIEYMAFVDDWNEVKAIVSDKTVVNVGTGGTGSVVDTETRSCVAGHASEATKVDGGYKVQCTICGTVITEFSVPDEINYYADLGVMNKYQAGTLEKFLYDEENDVLYNRYEGNAASHINLTGGVGAGTWTENKYVTGEYLVIKYRMQSSAFHLNIATKDFGKDPKYNDNTRPNYSGIGTRKCPTGLSYWSVALIKIPDGINYTKNSEQEIGIMISTESSPYILDIAYLAIVDSPEEAKLLLREGEVLEDLGESWNGTITEVMPEEEIPEEDREFTSTKFGPDELLNPPENTTGTFNITKLEENGVSFVRIDNMTVNGSGWAAINYVNSAKSVKARYFAMKFRIGDNGLDQTYLKLYTGTNGALQNEGQGVAFKVVEGGEWCVIVVDILKSIGDKGTYMAKNPDGSYTLRYFGIRPFSNNQKGAVGTTAYMDIAYITFFEHESQIKDVVDTETYELSIDKNTNTTLKTEDSSCVVCSLSEVVDGKNYSYVCASCGKVYKTVTLTDAVTKYYSANEIATTGKVYYTTSGGTTSFASDDGVPYAHNQNMTQIIWQRAQADMDGRNNSAAAQHFTESVGNAKYIVIKARANDASGNLHVFLSTTAYNAPLKVATENMPGYCKGHTNQRDEWEVDGEIVKGVLAGGEYRADAGWKRVTLIPTGAGNGEWQTYVIDLALFEEAYAKVEGANDYVIDTFFMNLGGDVDISYIAFVEGDITDVAELVEESQVAKISDKDGKFEMFILK